MMRRVPRLRTDEEAEAFLETDLSGLDFSQFKSGRLRIDEAVGAKSAAETAASVPSETYRLFEQAMLEKKQILCTYDGYHRELCPIILGHSNGKEKALTYQFGGEGRSILLPGGDWRCLFLANVTEVRLRKGRWYAGGSHRQPSSCVEEVDLDVNPDSPYNPKRLLQTR
jgi:hypothetical protein